MTSPAPSNPALRVQVVIDCADPHRLAAFWVEALGYGLDSDPAEIQATIDAGFATDADVTEYAGRLVWRTGEACRDPDDRGPRLFLQQVPEAKAGKNRVHLDLHTASPAERDVMVERLLGLGASKLYDGQLGPHSWVTLADPEGNEFCVA